MNKKYYLNDILEALAANQMGLEEDVRRLKRQVAFMRLGSTLKAVAMLYILYRYLRNSKEDKEETD